MASTLILTCGSRRPADNRAKAKNKNEKYLEKTIRKPTKKWDAKTSRQNKQTHKKRGAKNTHAGTKRRLPGPQWCHGWRPPRPTYHPEALHIGIPCCVSSALLFVLLFLAFCFADLLCLACAFAVAFVFVCAFALLCPPLCCTSLLCLVARYSVLLSCSNCLTALCLSDVLRSAILFFVLSYVVSSSFFFLFFLFFCFFFSFLFLWFLLAFFFLCFLLACFFLFWQYYSFSSVSVSSPITRLVVVPRLCVFFSADVPSSCVSSSSSSFFVMRFFVMRLLSDDVSSSYVSSFLTTSAFLTTFLRHASAFPSRLGWRQMGKKSLRAQRVPSCTTGARVPWHCARSERAVSAHCARSERALCAQCARIVRAVSAHCARSERALCAQ